MLPDWALGMRGSDSHLTFIGMIKGELDLAWLLLDTSGTGRHFESMSLPPFLECGPFDMLDLASIVLEFLLMFLSTIKVQLRFAGSVCLY